jgi:hypothetical protein
MVPHASFINKIRALDYTYKTRQKRTDLWRKKGGTHYMSVPLCDFLTDEYVTSALTQAGCTAAQVKEFLAAAKC